MLRRIALSSKGNPFTLELLENPGACAVLFYPGTMVCPRQYAVPLAALYKAGFAVAGLHLTGHGCNPHKGPFTFDTLVSNGLSAEDWLIRHGYPDVLVVGHSQGAICTLAHAAAPATRARAAFSLAGILPQLDETLGLTLFRRIARHRNAISRILEGLAHCVPLLPLPVIAYLSMPRILKNARPFYAPEGGGRLSYPVTFLASLFNARISTRTRCPLSLVFAPDDALFTPAVANALREAYAGSSDVRLLWTTGGGHLFPFNPPLAVQIAARIADTALALGLSLNTAHGVSRGL